MLAVCRRLNNEDIKNAVQAVGRYNMPFYMNFIIGGPEDTAASIQRTARFIKKAGLVLVSVFVYRPLPRTALCEQVSGLSEAEILLFCSRGVLG